MSNLPSRTRSLRKPADKPDANANSSERAAQSPSRLPVKGSARPRPLSLSSAASLSYVSSTSTSMRPPPPRANISKPATNTTGLYRSSSSRRANLPSTPTDPDPSKTDRSTQSRPAQETTRHLRHGSVSSTITSGSSRVSGHTRSRTSSTVLSTSTALPPPSRNAAEDPNARGPAAASQTRKPAFSTLQQHYSPAKNLAPKPHPAAFLAPPTPSKRPENVAISAETAKLQNELLQLHLLHKEAARVEREWRVSAKRKLGQKFEDVVKEHEDLVRVEEEEMGRINAAALKKWGEGFGLEEKTQLLESILSGVWNMGEAGGKYTRVVRKFAKWMVKVQEILGARDHEDGEDIIFIEELDSGWKDDCLVLGRKLESWKNQLRDLGTPDEGSSLAIVMQGCRSLVEGMVDELGIMAKIERDAVRIESEWIKAMNDHNTDDEDRKLPTTGAAWRSR